MRKKVVDITMINGDKWWVPEEEFSSFGVGETPTSVISNFIRGSRGPLLRVNSREDMSGNFKHVNANFILDMNFEYVDVTPPNAVTGLSETHTDTSVTLTWSNPTEDFNSVRVLRDGSEVGSGITNETFTDSEITANTSYTYKVFALDKRNNQSEEATITVQTNTSTS